MVTCLDFMYMYVCIERERSGLGYIEEFVAPTLSMVENCSMRVSIHCVRLPCSLNTALPHENRTVLVRLHDLLTVDTAVPSCHTDNVPCVCGGGVGWRCMCTSCSFTI